MNIQKLFLLVFLLFHVLYFNPVLIYIHDSNDKNFRNVANSLLTNHAKHLKEKFSEIKPFKQSELKDTSPNDFSSIKNSKVLIVANCHGSRDKICQLNHRSWMEKIILPLHKNNNELGFVTDACDSGNFFAPPNYKYDLFMPPDYKYDLSPYIKFAITGNATDWNRKYGHSVFNNDDYSLLFRLISGIYKEPMIDREIFYYPDRKKWDSLPEKQLLAHVVDAIKPRYGEPLEHKGIKHPDHKYKLYFNQGETDIVANLWGLNLTNSRIFKIKTRRAMPLESVIILCCLIVAIWKKAMK